MYHLGLGRVISPTACCLNKWLVTSFAYRVKDIWDTVVRFLELEVVGIGNYMNFLLLGL